MLKFGHMKNYFSVVKSVLIVSLVLTIMLPAGILMIIFGAGKNTLMLVFGIVFTVAGFYGAPIIWIKYGDCKRKAFVYRLITSENMYTVKDIVAQTSYQEEIVNNYINSLLSQGYITGYFFKDGKLILNTNKKQTEASSEKKKCPCCGGMMSSDGINFYCEYCGHSERKDQ